MGKVYDALRRAEAQRADRQRQTTGAVDPVEMTPAAMRAEPERVARRSAGGPRSVLSRLLSRSRASDGIESGTELNKRRIALLQPDSPVAEQFRSLRARLDSLAASRPLRTLAVTSALPGDGKTLSAVSLAVVTAMNLGRRVLLIDCDMRRPAVAPSLGLRVNAGLAEVLMGTASLADAVVKVDGTTLEVLPVRSLPSNPAELLGSDAMKQLIEEVADRYDRVILDVAPTLGLPDAKELADLCDGVVFVVRADQTPADDVTSAIDVIGRQHVVGMVLNGATPSGYARYGYR